MRKSAMCAIMGASALLTACTAKPAVSTNEETVTEFQSAADSSWREGKNYLSYDVNDKNGSRKLWIDFGEEMAAVYEDNGTELTVLNYGALADIEYAKSGLRFDDVDNDGYVDVSMPYVKNEFGSYTYYWIYNFVDRKFAEPYSELTNEKEVLWLIANGVLGQNSSRQITQIFNSPDIGVVNGSITLADKKCRAYNIVDNGSVRARLYFDQTGDWYIDSQVNGICSIISSRDDAYVFDGVCATSRAKGIASYTLGDYYANPNGVASDITALWTAAGDSSVAASAVQNAINGVVSAYEIVIDDQGTIRRMSRDTNVFTMACQQLGVNSAHYDNIR